MGFRRPGQFARTFSLKLAAAFGLVLVLSVPLMWLLGLPLYVGPLLWAVVAAGLHRADLDELHRWHRGARGEERVGAVLESLRTDGYRALHDIDTGRGNIDHVLVGPTGVFAIETKAWSQKVWLAKGGILMCGRRNQEGVLSQVKREASEVQRRLDAAGITRRVEPIVVLASPTLPKGRIVKSPVTIVELADLRAFVARPRRSTLDRNEIARALTAIHRNGGRPTALNITFEAPR
jgi:hypothetical protein